MTVKYTLNGGSYRSMVRYKPYDTKQVTLAVSFADQILPGSFEYALNEIVDQHIDLRPFCRYWMLPTGFR